MNTTKAAALVLLGASLAFPAQAQASNIKMSAIFKVNLFVLVQGVMQCS